MGANVPFLRTFLDILLGNGPKYDSDDIDCYAPLHMRYRTNGECPIGRAPELMPSDQGPCSPMSCL